MGEPASAGQHGPGHADHGHADHGHHADLPDVLDQAYWDERYGSKESMWSGDPNAQLVAEVGGLAPGRALDVGSGEGGDSVWLARRGWQVTGVDISETALGRARAHAEEAGTDLATRITWIRDDITTFDPGASSFDLVSAHFLPLPGDLRDGVLLRLARAVAPGGTLLLVAHDPTDVAMVARMPAVGDFFAGAGQMAAVLPAEGWDVLVTEARPRTVDDPEGGTMTIHDAVLVARRTDAA